MLHRKCPYAHHNVFSNENYYFVIGLVRQYDTERKKSNELDNWTDPLRKATPSYAANRHDVGDYGRVVQHEFEKRDFKPWQSTAYYAPNTRSKYPIPPTCWSH